MAEAIRISNELIDEFVTVARYGLLLSKVQDLNALDLIAQDLQDERFPGVSGLVPETEAFVQIWQTLTKQSYQRRLELRIYQLIQVEPITAVHGYLRLATPSDRPLLLQWFAAFDDVFHSRQAPPRYWSRSHLERV